MWSIESPADKVGDNLNLSVERVLFAYDEPSIFTSIVGFLRLLFVKVEEEDGYDLYIACQISEAILSLILDNKLSLKSAFERDIVYIIKVTPSYKIDSYWVCAREDVPEQFIPASSVGLAVSSNSLPNSLLQIRSYFAMGFKGRTMRRAGMPFGLFKAIVDSSYDAARRILAPAMLARSRSATFDFQISRPQFSSFVVALNEPIINEENVRRVAKNKNLSGRDVSIQMDANRSHFFEEMSELITLAEGSGISDSFAADNIALLDNISQIIPTEENRIENLEINANIKSEAKYLFIDEKIGQKINVAHKIASFSQVLLSGVIFLINSSSDTFSIFAKNGREVTCSLSPEMYSELSKDNLFKNGSLASVRGNIERKPRRDYLRVTTKPILSAPTLDSIFD